MENEENTFVITRPSPVLRYYRLEVVKLMFYNVAITILLMNPNSFYLYLLQDMKTDAHIGDGLKNVTIYNYDANMQQINGDNYDKPTLHDKLGVLFRFYSLLSTGMFFLSVLRSERRYRDCLLLSLLWSVYMFGIVGDIMMDLCRALYLEKASLYLFGGLFITLMFMTLQCLLGLKIIVFYGLLNFVQ